jgi:hypothetical protein
MTRLSDATAPTLPPRARRAVVLGALGQRTRRVVVVSLTLLLVACSSIKLGYNNADTLLVYSLDSYFDLDEAQEKLARERVRELMGWHRQTQLAQYARFVDEAQRKLDGPVSAADVLAVQEAINLKLARLGEQAAPELARLALTLRPEQLTHFADKLARDTAKARRELVRSAGRQTLDERVKTYAERAEGWLGPLNREQMELVRTALAARPSGQPWWLDERERRQRDMVAVLRRIQAEQPAAEVATGWLREYFAQLALPADAERRARILQFRQDNAVLNAALLNAAGPQQKATLVKKLRGYADDLTQLAGSGARG